MGKKLSKRKNKEINSDTGTVIEYSNSSTSYENIRKFQRSESSEYSCSVADDWSFEDFSMSRDMSSGTYPEPDTYYTYNGNVDYSGKFSPTTNTTHAWKRSVKDFRPMKTDKEFDFSVYTSNTYARYNNMPQFQNRNLDNSQQPQLNTRIAACNTSDVTYSIPPSNTGRPARAFKDFRPTKTDTEFDYSVYTSNMYARHNNRPQLHIPNRIQNRNLDNSQQPQLNTRTEKCNSIDITQSMPASNTGRPELVWPRGDIRSPIINITSETYVKQHYSSRAGLAAMSRDTPSNTSRPFDAGPHAMDWRPDDPESSADSISSKTYLKQTDLQSCTRNDTDVEYSDTSFRLSESTVENNKRASLSVSYMVEAFKETIALTVKVEEILPYLTVLGIDDAEFDLRKNSKDAVFHLISKIQSSEVDGKWQAFLDALNQAEYQYIADLLQCKTEKDHTIARELLKLITPNLAKNIDTEYFVDCLFEKEVITEQDMEEITREKDRRGPTAASLMLLQKLPRRATNWVRIFRDVLRKSGMETVAADFDSDTSSKGKNKGRPLPRLPTSVPRTQTEPKLLEYATRSPSTDSGRSSAELTDDDGGRPLPRLPISVSWTQTQPKLLEHFTRSLITDDGRSSRNLTDDDQDCAIRRTPITPTTNFCILDSYRTKDSRTCRRINFH